MLSSLQAAVDHAEGKEWTERPAYQNGLAGYDLWALVLDRWAMIVDAGRADRLPLDVPDHAGYYAAIHYSARCYARDYIAALADGDEKLEGAARAYAEVASCLRSVWKAFPGERKPGADLLASLADDIGSARLAEEAAVNYLREYVTDPTRSVR
jgi:hypothetical protein